MRRDEVLTILAAHQQEIKRLRVRSLLLFASVARDEAGPESDVDLLVELERPAGFFALTDLHEYLQQILGARVDLVTSGGLKGQLRERVQREAIRAA